jgi:hypothetical protein
MRTAGAGLEVDGQGRQKVAQQQEYQEPESVPGLEHLHRGGARLVVGAGNPMVGENLEAQCLEGAFHV